MRHDGPLMLNTTALFIRRSKMAAATTGSPKIRPHSGSPRLVMISVGGPLSYRVFTTWKKAGTSAFDPEQSDVVDDEHARGGQGPELRSDAPFSLGLHQGVDHVIGGCEVAPIP